MIHVAIVDDNKSIVSTLTDALKYSGKVHVSFSAFGGAAFLEKLQSCSREEFPQIVIADVNMPGMSGIEVVRHCKALFPQLKFIMLTVADDEDTLFDAIQAGASGYLMKDEPMQGIIEHIESLFHAGSVPMSPRIARKTLDLLSRSEKQPTAQAQSDPGEMYNLSHREMEVLNLLVEGYDYKAIADQLIISPFTVRKHISNIYEKLHISSKTQAIKLMQHHTRNSRNADHRSDAFKILLVDDHQIILDSLSMMLSTMPDVQVAGKISDSRNVMSFLESHEVDLMISDISMPYLSGLKLAEDVRIRFPHLKTLMLTVSDDKEDITTAYNLGVSGYVLKKASKDELNTAIRTVMRGERYFEAVPAVPGV